VPEPAKGSRTVPPGGTTRRIIQAAKSRGYAAGWPRESVWEGDTATQSRQRAIPLLKPDAPASHFAKPLPAESTPILSENFPFALGSQYGCRSLENHKMRSQERRGRLGCPTGGAAGFIKINSSHSIHPASRNAK